MNSFGITGRKLKQINVKQFRCLGWEESRKQDQIEVSVILVLMGRWMTGSVKRTYGQRMPPLCEIGSS
jgi:hypothetical protein